jgi:hypothetical protein
MTTTLGTRRINVGTMHPDLYSSLTDVAILADNVALVEGLSPLLTSGHQRGGIAWKGLCNRHGPCDYYNTEFFHGY